jgi:5-methyltetrahydrofolate--homocysteine methyltransferase
MSSPINELPALIADRVERGKATRDAPHPAELRGRDGVSELVAQALAAGVPAAEVLQRGLLAGMARVGEKFRDRLIFVPDVLLAARAMTAGMQHLQPYFRSNDVTHRGTLILGTVQGDLHDIGKRLVGMVVEGAGYRVVDLGIDVPPERFIDALREYPRAAVGLSALLTTTMGSMERTVAALRAASPSTHIIIGGAPVSARFAEAIGADGYADDPQGAVDFLGKARDD